MSYGGHIDMLSKIYRNGGIYALCNHVCSGFRSPKIILDLGAHHGLGYTLFGINHPDAEYIMVEPVQKCIDRITELIEKHPEARIRLIDGVIARTDGIAEMNTFTSDGGQSSNLFSDRGGAYGRSNVEIVKTFNYDVLPTHIDFAKVNIEGGEYDLIADGFLDRIDTFVMEVHNNLVPNKSYRDVLASLSRSFNIVTCGNLDYKYCFCIGHRI